MKRDFLKNLDLGDGARLPDTAIDAIMAEYGKTVNPLKESVTAMTKEREELQGKLTDAQKQLTDTQGLQAQIQALQSEKTIREVRDKVSAETGIPTNLLTGETEESCTQQAKALLEWQGKQPKYPAGNDGGESPAASSGATRDQFADWFRETVG